MKTLLQNQAEIAKIRHLKVINLRENESKTFTQIAAILGISKSRTSQIYRCAKNRQKEHEIGESGNPFYGLSVRAANCCNNAGLMNRQQIKQAIENGHLRPKNSKVRNYGKKTHTEIYKWLGLPEPQQIKSGLKICSHCGKLLDN